MCEWLAKRGHSVRVVCPPPYYPFWKAQPPYSPWRYRSESIAGAAVSRCPIWTTPKPRGLKRLLYALSFALSSFPVMLRQMFRRPDVVLAIEPSLLNAIPSLVVARCSGALAWLQVQDFEIDLAFDLQQLRNPRLRGLALAAESWLMRRFDVVSTISGRMLDRLREKGVAEPQCVLFPNWVDTSIIYPMEGPAELSSTLGIGEGEIVALFSGSTGAKQGLDVLIDAARLLAGERHIAIVICGAGTEGLQARAKGLDNVRFLPLQPIESLNGLLNAAHIHLLPQKASAADLVMPSKLLGMLASGRPVIATAEAWTEVAKVVSQCGIVVPPEDAAALADAIVRLAGDPELRGLLGRRARELATTLYEKDSIIAEFEKVLLSRLRTGLSKAVVSQ